MFFVSCNERVAGFNIPIICVPFRIQCGNLGGFPPPFFNGPSKAGNFFSTLNLHASSYHKIGIPFGAMKDANCTLR